MDNREKDRPEAEERDSWPDEAAHENRAAGDHDPYLAEIAHKSREASQETSCSTPFASRGWTGEDRRGNSIDSFDPYVVELTRPNRSDV